MYRCDFCRRSSASKVGRLLFTVHRTVTDRDTFLPRREIAKEYPVCPDCLRILQNGTTPAQLRGEFSTTQVVPDVTVVTTTEVPRGRVITKPIPTEVTHVDR